jgi:excisionase family DNA binding protein
MTGQSLRERMELITIDELAEFLGVKRTTLAQWRCAKRGPDYVKAGRNIFYRKVDVDEWLQMNLEITDRSAPVREAAE